MKLKDYLLNLKETVRDTNIWVEILNTNQITLDSLYLEDFGNYGLSEKILNSEVVYYYSIREKEETNPINIIEVRVV